MQNIIQADHICPHVKNVKKKNMCVASASALPFCLQTDKGGRSTSNKVTTSRFHGQNVHLWLFLLEENKYI